MPRRFWLVLGTIVFTIGLAGCWDVEDISNRGTANAIFLDKGKEDKIRLGCSFHVPGSLLPPYFSTTQLFFKRNTTLYGEGKGLLDAWKDLQTRATRDVYFGQIGAIILSDQIANSNLRDVLDFLNRRAEIPSDAAMVVTKEDPAKLIDTKLENNFVPGTYIQRYFQSSAKHSLAIPVKIWHINAALANQTSDPFMPIMQRSQGQYRIGGMMLFSGGHRVGEISIEETQDLSLLIGTTYAYISVPLGTSGLVAFFDVESKTKIKPTLQSDGSVSFDVKVEIPHSGLRETIPENVPITMKEKNKYEEQVERYLKKQIEKLLLKLRDLNSDPVGFGRKVRAKYPKEWDKLKWHEVYPKSNFQVTVDFKFNNTGVFR